MGYTPNQEATAEPISFLYEACANVAAALATTYGTAPATSMHVARTVLRYRAPVDFATAVHVLEVA